MASRESKLLALHRLDFYKRKKNWKLPEDVRKEVPPKPPKIINKLDKTYDIVEEFPEPEFDVQQVSPHDKAFLDKTGDTDDALEHQLPGDVALEHQLPDDVALETQLPVDEALEPQLPDDEALEPQLLDDDALETQLPVDEALEPQLPDDEALEPQLLDDDALETQLPVDEALEPQLLDDDALEPQLPDHEALEPQLPDDEATSLPPLENMFRPDSLAEQVWSGDKTDSLWEEFQQRWCGTEDKGVREELAYDHYDDGACNQHSLWRPDPASQLELQPSVDPLGCHLKTLTPEQICQISGEWLTLHNYPVKQEEYADTDEEDRVEDGTAEFMRGSHYAPHSTEIDLNITPECGCTCNNMYGLPVGKLAEAIRRHHSALTVLLREQALRERLYSHSLPHHPLRLLQPDVVLSGSHNVPSDTGCDVGTGRGRGRLQQRRHVVIGMGRPYWKVNEIAE